MLRGIEPLHVHDHCTLVFKVIRFFNPMFTYHINAIFYTLLKPNPVLEMMKHFLRRMHL